MRCPLWRDMLQRQAFLVQSPPPRSLSLDRDDRPLVYGKKWGCSSNSLRCHRKHKAPGVLLHLSRDRGGYFGRVTKKNSFSDIQFSKNLKSWEARQNFCAALPLNEVSKKSLELRNLPRNPSGNVSCFPGRSKSPPPPQKKNSPGSSHRRFLRSEKSQNENFSNFCPEFCPEFLSEFSPNFLRSFRASFRGKRRPKNIHQKFPPFLNAKLPGKHEENIHILFLERRQSKDLRSRPPFTGVLRGPGLKVPHGVLFEQFWAPASECPRECFLSVFWRFFGPKNAKKHSKNTLWGTPRQVPKIAQKALRGALSGPGPGALL